MGTKRYRQLLGLFVALVLPSIAIAWLGWQVLRDQRVFDSAQAERDRQAEVTDVSADIRDRLNLIKEQEIAAPSSIDGYSDSSVALVAWVEGGRFLLPWESIDEPKPEMYRKASDDLESIIDNAHHLMGGGQQPAQAAELLRTEIQKQPGDIHRDILWSLLRLALQKDGRQQEADDLAVERLLKLPSDTVDDAGKPLWQTDAAAILIEEGAREPEVLSRIEQDLKSFSTLARWNVSLRDLLVRLTKSSDASIARDAATDLDLLKRRMERLEQLRRLPQAEALKAAFATTLGVTPEKWPPFPASGGEWFVGMGPQSGGQSVVVAIRVEDIVKNVESDRKTRGLAQPFRLVAGSANGYPMGDSLPGWRAVPVPQSGADNTGGAKGGISRQEWFYALSLALILGMTFFGGHLLWRDTRRESRMAELRSQFVSSVSHELKTPLTGIRMLAETLQIPGMSDPRTHAEYLDTIVGETERLTRLLNNVLDFSKIERGQKSYHMETASLADVLSNVARTMRFPLAEQGFDFRMDVSGDVPPARVDRDAIEQAVLNLVSNAMKYSGESRVIDLRLSSENGTAKIQVVDRGIGIPPEESKRIFEKFYRVQTPDNRAISGTGLGLALVAHIVEAHGGRVGVESELGKGSTFTIHLPIDLAAVAVSDRPEIDAPAYDEASRRNGAKS